MSKNYFLPSILIILFWFSPCTAWEGRVVSVVDGDTIKVLLNTEADKPVKIRLYGLDTPEKKQDYGQAATQFTADLVFGKIVSVEIAGTDRYGRQIGLVTISGKSLNAELIKSGYAWVYTRYCKKDFCQKWQELETEARNNGCGLFKAVNPIKPWIWRKEKRKK